MDNANLRFYGKPMTPAIALNKITSRANGREPLPKSLISAPEFFHLAIATDFGKLDYLMKDISSLNYFFGGRLIIENN